MPKMLSHEEMKDVIARGGVMQMPDGRTIHRVEDLPDPADLAVASDDTESRAIVRAELQRKIEETQRQLSKLDVAESSEKSGTAAKGQADAEARAKADADAAEARKKADAKKDK